jgi:carbohydrate-binding DOMON domain-containing protein
MEHEIQQLKAEAVEKGESMQGLRGNLDESERKNQQQHYQLTAVNTHTHINIYTHTNTYTHTQTHTHIHTHTHTHAHARTLRLGKNPRLRRKHCPRKPVAGRSVIYRYIYI